MLSLLNKTGGDKAGAAQSIPWRPDFRDVGALPDTKTVRTTFFINSVAVALTGALALFTAYREREIYSRRGDLDDVEARITATTPASQKAQASYKQFQAEEAKFNEAHALVKDPFRYSHFIRHLGEVMPPGVAIRRADYRSGVNVTVLGAVRGLDAAASDVASGFVKQLQGDRQLLENFASIELRNLGRNVDEGCLNLELVFTFKNAKGAVKK